MCCPSATLVVWSAAWLAQRAAPDDALDALLHWGHPQEIVAADAGAASALEFERASSAAELLAALRRNRAGSATLVLPAAGDVRGLGVPGPFARAALARGEAAVLDGLGLGIVPEQAPDNQLIWTVYNAPEGGGGVTAGLAEAERELRDAVRASTSDLLALEVASHRPEAHEAVRERLSSAQAPPWPEGMPPRAVGLLQRADEVDAIVAMAAADEPGAALSASAAEQRAAALRPLASAVRTARCAAVSEAVRVLGGYADRHR
ncbi:hypothetical protein [Haloechinothrix sp. LS1_15]|uniref:hypothetical protein n=1 Tax=Haloechinothrix sp. LS1_15 TaxID=2652248 RepID=UPI002948AD81|nr:hypothetical protein [Haloechinothrix sp. LS1_15]MDV6013957.1 hypothetical protein [Haloechinothrix sp. LS1_15]